MTDIYLDVDSFNNILAKPLRLYERGLLVWNRTGLNYRALMPQAKDISIAMLQQSVDLFESLKKEHLSPVQESFIGAHIQLANGQILFVLSSCEDMTTLESIQERYRLLMGSIELREKAYAAFTDTTVDNGKSFLRSLQLSILGDNAMALSLNARIHNRQKDFEGALNSFKESEDIYSLLLKNYEGDSPKLVDVSKKIHSRIQSRDVYENKGDIEGIEWGGYSIVFDDDFGEVPDLDMYQRIWANYYSVKASQHITNANILISQHNYQKLIVKEIDSAILYIYSAMEFFPNQLNFHQDLFNAYRMKGTMFGCAIPRRANFYYINCPLAIMRYVGHWYLSAGIRYKSLVCNVCGKDALDCQHTPGEVVDGTIVEYSREGLFLEEISIVDIPRDPRCRIKEIKIPVNFFDGIIPKGKTQLEEGELFCHLCNVKPLELEKFPLLIDLGPESAEKARKKYMTILGLDLSQK